MAGQQGRQAAAPKTEKAYLAECGGAAAAATQAMKEKDYSGSGEHGRWRSSSESQPAAADSVVAAKRSRIGASWVPAVQSLPGP